MKRLNAAWLAGLSEGRLSIDLRARALRISFHGGDHDVLGMIRDRIGGGWLGKANPRGVGDLQFQGDNAARFLALIRPHVVSPRVRRQIAIALAFQAQPWSNAPGSGRKMEPYASDMTSTYRTGRKRGKLA